MGFNWDLFGIYLGSTPFPFSKGKHGTGEKVRKFLYETPRLRKPVHLCVTCVRVMRYRMLNRLSIPRIWIASLHGLPYSLSVPRIVFMYNDTSNQHRGCAASDISVNGWCVLDPWWIWFVEVGSPPRGIGDMRTQQNVRKHISQNASSWP